MRPCQRIERTSHTTQQMMARMISAVTSIEITSVGCRVRWTYGSHVGCQGCAGRAGANRRMPETTDAPPGEGGASNRVVRLEAHDWHLQDYRYAGVLSSV